MRAPPRERFRAPPRRRQPSGRPAAEERRSSCTCAGTHTCLSPCRHPRASRLRRFVRFLRTATVTFVLLAAAFGLWRWHETAQLRSAPKPVAAARTGGCRDSQARRLPNLSQWSRCRPGREYGACPHPRRRTDRQGRLQGGRDGAPRAIFCCKSIHARSRRRSIRRRRRRRTTKRCWRTASATSCATRRSARWP